MKTRLETISKTILFAFIYIIFSAHCILAGSFSPIDKEQVIESSNRVTPEKYPNADFVYVDEKTFIQYDNDGKYREWHESFIKILTEKGKRENKTITSSFTIPYNTTRFTLVEVIRPDGTILPVDVASNSSEVIEQSQMDSNIYDPNHRILRLSVPKINIGDMLHFIMHDVFDKARMPDTFSDYVVFESTNPIMRYVYMLDAPKDMPIRSVSIKNELSRTITHAKKNQGDRIIYTWTASDVPRAYKEPEMPPLYTQAQRLLISTIPDWETVSRWYWELCRPHIEKTTPEMKEIVNGLVRDIDNDERIEAVFRWVSQEIRYLGITLEDEAPGYEPHDASMTFERRAGVCRDKAALLVAMLRLAGFDAYPVLIMNGPKKDIEVPQPYFNHAICSVGMKDGTYLLMDPTDENTREIFPAYLNNQSYLVARPEGETLLTSPVPGPQDNMMKIDTKAQMDEAGNIEVKADLVFEGINDNAYRSYFSRSSIEERRLFFEKIIKKTLPGAMIDDLTITPYNMLDTSEPLSVSISYHAPDIRIPGESTVMIPSMRMGDTVGIINFIIGKMGLKERRFTYDTGFTCGVSEVIELNLGNAVGETLSLPEHDPVGHKGVTWKREFALGKDTLTCTSLFTLNKPEYSPEEYTILKQALRHIEVDNRKMPVFAYNRSAEDRYDTHKWYHAYSADAVILEAVDEFDISSETQWTEIKHLRLKVLTYAGKKRFSDLYIPYNPAWEDVEVVHAEVSTPSGDIKSIKKKEMNLMDSKWAGDAPRYPAGKILVVSLPGVEEGSIIDVKIARKKKDRLFFSINGDFCYQDALRIANPRSAKRNIFSAHGAFSSFEPIEKKTLRIKAPKDFELSISPLEKTQFKGGPVCKVNKSVTSQGDRCVYEFSSEKIRPVKKEAFLPPWYSFNPVVFVSSGTWKGYAEALNKVLESAASGQNSARGHARELIRGKLPDKDKIKAIRDFVARNIQPIDVAVSELPIDCITEADRTLADGYGNGADRAVVLYAMLDEAGFDPEFVLSSWAPDIDGRCVSLMDYPAPDWFRDVLVRVKKDKRYIYLGDTDQYAPVGSTAGEGRTCLALEGGDLGTVQALTENMKDRTSLRLNIDVSPEGDITLKTKKELYGMDYASFHKLFSEMPPEERDRHFQEKISSISQAAVAVGEYVTDYGRYPAIEEFSVRISPYATRQDDYLYLALPGLATSIRGAGSDFRESPLYMSWKTNMDITIDVIMPDGVESVEVLPPESYEYSAGNNHRISMSSSTKDGCVRISQYIDSEKVIVPVSEYTDLLDANRIFSHPKTRMIVLKMK